MTFPKGTTVFHPLHGEGEVRTDLCDTVIVRFASGIEELLASELTSREPSSQQGPGSFDDPGETIAKAMALCIRSVNDQWGVFGRTRVQMLPHQLWVCHRILQSWPNRWLIADDVGLGKTIEAGLAVLALTSKQIVNRILILCPASLCQQWQERMLRMFDLRFQVFNSADAHRDTAWDVSSQVIASLHTVRNFAVEKDDEDPRMLAMLSAKPWDLIIVDEAHHLNHSEGGGQTLGYRLIKKLDDEGQLKGMLLFTGTPHRGKDFQFLALLHLINPQIFSPHRPIEEQLPHLHNVMIRNNKQAVTDLDGNRLFQNVVVRMEEHAFSDNERLFYERMTAFILSGRTYADNLSLSSRRTNHLVLTTLQKLASSSIAAVSHTLKKRLIKIKERKDPFPQAASIDDMWSAPEPEQGDLANMYAENLTEESDQLLVGEPDHLARLITLANAVGSETKIERIISMARDLPNQEPLLIFTEFKATQRALLLRLAESFGKDSVTFLNGDGLLRDIPLDLGGPTIQSTKEDAAFKFNHGLVRFLISTEAGGEGIDLQHRCNSIIHADLPWNPMRIHQRNGRLYRLNQKRQVHVTLLRNPESLESRIWDLLEEKLQRVQRAYSGAMENPDDIAQLVLGMAPAGTYERMHIESLGKSDAEISEGVHQSMSFIDSHKALRAAMSIFGNCSKFDFGQSLPFLPRVELKNLMPFVDLSLRRHGRSLKMKESNPDNYDVQTPDAWTAHRGIKLKYKDLHFDRARGGKDALLSLVGIGHPLIDYALREAVNFPGKSCLISSSDLSLALVRIQDRITSGPSDVSVCCGILLSTSRDAHFLYDWQTLQALNCLGVKHRSPEQLSYSSAARLDPTQLDGYLENAMRYALQNRSMVRPQARIAMLIHGIPDTIFDKLPPLPPIQSSTP